MLRVSSGLLGMQSFFFFFAQAKLLLHTGMVDRAKF